MKTTVSARSMGSLAPYVISAALVFPSITFTARSTNPGAAEAYTFVDVAQHGASVPSDDLSVYSWDPARPELTPFVLVHPARDLVVETYEPFVASEGWRQLPSPEGPFLVEEEPPPGAFLDDYDLSAIALYEQ